MKWADVQARIARGADENTELGRLRSFQEKSWLEALCAFANTEGGVIVLGVADDGRVDGVPMDPNDVQERLTSSLQTALSAPVHARVGSHHDPAGWIHWIEVARMRGAQPLRLRGRVWVRRHRSNVEPADAELMELYNTFGFVFTEERLIPGTTSADIEVAAYRSYMLARGIDLDPAAPLPWEEEFRRAEIVGPGLDDAVCATLYGLMCFGREPQGHHLTRGFFVQGTAYAGKDRAAPVLSSTEARGRLDEQVRRVEDWMLVLGKTEHYEGWERIDRGVVPSKALREAIVNAVAHRDYAILGSRVMVDVFDDRVEVTSPGALPNHKTAESVLAGGPPRSRNESMADFLLVRRLMERRGTGLPRIRAEMLAFNGTEPELVNHKLEAWVRLTLWRR